MLNNHKSIQYTVTVPVLDALQTLFTEAAHSFQKIGFLKKGHSFVDAPSQYKQIYCANAIISASVHIVLCLFSLRATSVLSKNNPCFAPLRLYSRTRFGFCFPGVLPSGM